MVFVEPAFRAADPAVTVKGMTPDVLNVRDNRFTTNSAINMMARKIPEKPIRVKRCCCTSGTLHLMTGAPVCCSDRT